MSIAVVDNYDSFTYNLVQYLEELGSEPKVFRNDEVTVDELGAFAGIVISPGPGRPEDAGVSTAAIGPGETDLLKPRGSPALIVGRVSVLGDFFTPGWTEEATVVGCRHAKP